MATTSQKIKVGVFLAVCGGILAVGVVAATTGFRSSVTKAYYVEFDESVAGLTTGSVVQYLGVEVGKVEDMHVTKEGLVRVKINVRPDKVVVKEGVKARLAPQGISGIVFVQLSEGAGRELAEGTTIVAERSLFGTVPDLMEKINATFVTLNSVLADIKSGNLQGELGQTVAGLNALIKQINDELVPDMRKTLAAVTGQVEEIGPSVRSTLDSANEKIAGIDVEQINKNLQEALTGIRDLAAKANETLDALNRAGPKMQRELTLVQHELDLTLSEMRSMLENMKRLAKSLEEDPSALFHGKSPRQN